MIVPRLRPVGVMPYALGAGLVVLLVGLVRERVPDFRATPRWLWAAVLIASLDLAWNAFWPRRTALAPAAFALLIGVGLGLAPVAAVALCFVSALCLGDLLLGGTLSRAHGLALPALAGWAALAFPFGMLAHWPGNSQVTFAALLCVPVLVNRRPLGELLSGLREVLSPGAPSAAPGLGERLLFWSFAISTSTVLVPTFMYDDRTTHLSLGSQLLLHGRGNFDVSQHLWAATANAGDVLYAIPHVIAGQDSRGALNFFYYLALLHLSGKFLELVEVTGGARYLAQSLVFSLPLTHALGFSMQAELGTTVFVLAALVALRLLQSKAPGAGLAILLLGGGIVAIKITGAFFVAPLFLSASVVFIGTRERGEPLLTLRRLGVVALAAGLALFGYAWCYAITKNPVFPLFNGVFHSPLFRPINFTNPRYAGHFDWLLPYGMTFRTSQFYESADGSLGFQFVALLPVLLVFLAWYRKTRALLPVLVPVLAFLGFTAVAQQYTRYLYPALVPLTLFLGLVWAAPLPRAGRWLLNGSTAAILVMNVISLRTVDSELPKGPLPLIIPSVREAFINDHAPEVAFHRYLNVVAKNDSRVLYAAQSERPFGADLAGTPIYLNWYNPDAQAAFAAASDVAAMKRFLVSRRVTHVITESSSGGAESPSRAALNTVLMESGRIVLSSGGVTLFELDLFSLSEPHSVLENTTFEHEAAGWSRIGHPEVHDGTVRVDSANYLFQRFPLEGAHRLKLTYAVRCRHEGEALVHLNWYSAENTPLPPQYERLPCTEEQVVHVEREFAAPEGAHEGEWYVEAAGEATVEATSLDLRGVP